MWIHKERNTWLPNREGEWTHQLTFKPLSKWKYLYIAILMHIQCLLFQRREEEKAETGRFWHRGEDWDFIPGISRRSRVQKWRRPLSAATKERSKGWGGKLFCVSNCIVLFITVLLNLNFYCACAVGLQNKLKKIKEKYKDQDEEDRELMMQLLGVRMYKCVWPCFVAISMYLT